MSSHLKESFLLAASETLERIEKLTRSGTGVWLHDDTCRALASAYSKGIEKLITQLAEVLQFECTEEHEFTELAEVLQFECTEEHEFTELAEVLQSASTEEHEFLNRIRWAGAKLGLVMKEGEDFAMACRCDMEDDVSWMHEALTKGLSTDAVDTHLHDFLVVLTAMSDAIEERAQGCSRQRHTFSSRAQHYEEEQQLQKPDIFWSDQRAKVAGRLLIRGDQLDAQRRNDLILLSLRVKLIADDGLSTHLRGAAKLLQARLTDQGGIGKGKIGPHLPLPPGVFVGWEGIHKIETISEREICTVHKVYWKPLGEDAHFALKEYRSGNREYFELEAQIHLRLHHPNVVPCTCLLEDQNKCGLLMELMDGTLSEFLKERYGSLSLAEKVGIMLNIAKGMEYVHGKGVIHRDLKTENVLVKQSGAGTVTVKVADFNVAKAKADSSSFTTFRIGTSVFRAPEVLAEEDEDSPKYTRSADVYSFAMVCFHILAGKEPFKGQNGFPSRGKKRWNLIRVHGVRPDVSQMSDGCCPPYVKHCLEAWWDGDPQSRPDFTEICRVLRHLYGSLLRCSDPLAKLPFMRWDKKAWEFARETTLESMRKWEGMRDWKEKGHACQYSSVNEIPYEMYVMRMALESSPTSSPHEITAEEAPAPNVFASGPINDSTRTQYFTPETRFPHWTFSITTPDLRFPDMPTPDSHFFITDSTHEITAEEAPAPNVFASGPINDSTRTQYFTPDTRFPHWTFSITTPDLRFPDMPTPDSHFFITDSPHEITAEVAAAPNVFASGPINDSTRTQYFTPDTRFPIATPDWTFSITTPDLRFPDMPTPDSHFFITADGKINRRKRRKAGCLFSFFSALCCCCSSMRAGL